MPTIRCISEQLWVMTCNKIRLFQKLTLKIQGQGHGWGESWKSQNGSNILSIPIPLIACQLVIPFLRYAFFKIWPRKSKVKVMVEVKVESHKVGVASYWLTSLSFYVNRPSHSWDTAFSKSTLKTQGQGYRWGGHWKSQNESNILSTNIPLIPCQSAIPFLIYNSFKIRPWKSKVKVMGDGNIESHKVGVTSYRLTSFSFRVNRPSHSWDTAFFKIWPWKSKVKVKWPYWCTTTGLDNSIKLGINQSNGFRDMSSAKCGPSAAWFEKFLANGQAHMKYYNCMFMLHASKYTQQAGFYWFCLDQTWNLICVHKIILIFQYNSLSFSYSRLSLVLNQTPNYELGEPKSNNSNNISV